MSSAEKNVSLMRLSIFWRLALGSLAIILVVAGVNLYALFQLRQLTKLNSELVSYHTPAIDQAKHLITSLYAQLRSEKQYRVVRDPVFLKGLDDEADEFRKTLTGLQGQETEPEGRKLLDNLQRLHQDYRRLVRERGERPSSLPGDPSADHELRRDALMTHMVDQLDAYIAVHENRVGTLVNEARSNSARAEAVMERLLVAAVVLGFGLAAIASVSILRPLRRIQEHIRRIGQGQFGASVTVEAPSDLRELVDTVNWMGVKLQELDEMKAEFLAHISHELRTPLASIREGTQLLLDEIPGPLGQAQRDTLQIMQDSSRRLIHLISTLLDLSKMEAGLMEYRLARADLVRTVDSSVRKIRLLAEGKRVRIQTETQPGGLWVAMDAARIEQVVDNLLSNAVKFSPEGATVQIRIGTDRATGAARCSVSDAGAGIPPEELPHVFERFYQGRRQEKHAVAGSGLGLALAQKVVEAHGGRIWIESQAGKGTMACFVLPLLGPGEAA